MSEGQVLRLDDPADRGERFIVVGYRARSGALLEQVPVAFVADMEAACWLARARVRRGETTFLIDRQKLEANDRRALGLEAASPGYDG